MKKITKLFFMLTAVLTTVSLSSCLDDDNETNFVVMTKEETRNVIMTVAGTYNTQFVYFPYQSAVLGNTIKPDTVKNVQFTLNPYQDENDTVLSAKVTTQFPIRILATYADKDSLIVKNCTNQPLTGKANMYTQQLKGYADQQAYQYYFNFGTKLTANDGQGNTITVKLINDQNLPYQQYQYAPTMMTYKNQVSGYILVDSVKVNSNAYKVGIPIALIGNK